MNRAPQFGYKSEHVIEVDDDLINKMIENTLRIGVFGKVEQKRRGEKIHMLEEMGVGNESSKASKVM